MKTFYITLVFLLTSGLEIKVDAGENSHQTEKLTKKRFRNKISKPSPVVSYPKNCVLEKVNCAIKTFKSSYELNLGDSKLSMGPETSVTINNEFEVELLSGYIVLDINTFKIKVVSSALNILPKSGIFMVTRSGEEVSVDNFTASVDIKANYNNEYFELRPAYNFTFDGVNRFVKYQVEFSRSVNYKQALKKWAKSYLGPKENFYDQVIAFKSSWKLATKQLSESYKVIVERNIASNNQKVKNKLARQKAYQNESQRLLNIFKSKNSM